MAAERGERAAEPGGGAGRECGVQCRLPQVACSAHRCACYRPSEVVFRACPPPDKLLSLQAAMFGTWLVLIM